MLVLTFTPFDREPRALKQARRLALDHDVTTAGFGPQPIEGLPHVEFTHDAPHSGRKISRLVYLALLGLRQYRQVLRFNHRDQAAFELLSGQKWDVVVANDVQTVPLAHRLAPRHGSLVDMHEYAPRQNEHSITWRFLIAPYFRWLCRTHVARAAAVTTVGQGIVDEYRKNFGFDARLVVNATPFQSLEPAAVSSPIRLVHSGIPAVARKLEIMIEAVRDTTANVTLDLYLIDDGSKYLRQLKELVGSSQRIQFKPAVPYAELVRTLNEYDVGISIIAPTTFNLAWCLPNKFFDFIQARLGVIVGPSPEMTRFVDDYGIGAVTDDFSTESFARLLENISEKDVRGWKTSSDMYARALSSEEQVEVWGQIVGEMLARP